jgi:uncharacterized protein with GYD domain
VTLIRQRPHQQPDLVALGYQGGDRMSADEPGPSRDEYSHSFHPHAATAQAWYVQRCAHYSPSARGHATGSDHGHISHCAGHWCAHPGRVYDLETAHPRGISMALYMYQASYTAKSMAAQLHDPQDPVEAIRPTLEEMGATIMVAGFPFGEYDVLVVYEAPDDMTAASVAMAIAAAGEVRSAKTTRLLSGQEWLESLRKRRIVTTRKAP